MKPKFITVVVIASLFLIFLLQNTQVVTLRLYFWQISMSQILLIPLTMLAGFVLGFIVAKLKGKGRPAKGESPVVHKDL